VTKSLRRAARSTVVMIGAVFALAIVVTALFAGALAPQPPDEQNFDLIEARPGAKALFGTDRFGRDVLSRVIYGSRLSLPLALLLVALATALGSLLGAMAGYFRSWVDPVVMRTTDLVFAFPAIILAMVVTASLGPNIRNAVLAIVIVAWPSYARVVRGLVLSIGDTEFVHASRLLGSSSRRTLVHDVLPNLAGPVVVLATLDLANAILLLAGLSFLGLGAQPPDPEWGSMVAVGTQYFQYWWMGTFPGLAIFTAVIAFNFLGDSLRDFFDPTSAADRGR